MSRLKIAATSLILLHATHSPANEILPQGYRIETIATPNNARFEIGGLDINNRGDVAIGTRDGDIWLLQHEAAQGVVKAESWRHFAEGLGEITGLLWDDDGSLLVAQKEELSRVLDSDGDEKADKHINLCNAWAWDQNYHEFHFGPVKDRRGNLYGTLNLASGLDGYTWRNLPASMSTKGGYRGWAYQLTKKGEFVPFAAGFRSPAGIGISPKQEIFVTDNQGDWVSTSTLSHVKKNHFYGHPVSLIDHPKWDKNKIDALETDDIWAMTHKPAVWLPHNELSRSPGNPLWDTTEGKFGPFSGQMFVPDHRNSSVFRVMLEKVKGEYQGAAIQFITGFQSGNIRIDYDPAGHMWVGQTGRGWPTKGTEPYGVQRVSWDAKSLPFELLDIHLTKTGFELEFTHELDVSRLNPAAVSVKQWHYHHSQEYGSAKIDEKTLRITGISLAKNKRTLSINLPLETGRVFAINFGKVRSDEGLHVSADTVYYTLNQLR